MRQISIILLFTIIFLNTIRAQFSYEKHYASRCESFKSNPINMQDIVMIGDSITEGGDWSSLFPNTNIKNRGIVSDIMQGVIDRLDEIYIGKPKKVFLLIGINDVSHNVSADSISKGIKRIINLIQTNCPDSKIYIQSLLPVNDHFNKMLGATKKGDIVIEANKKIEKMCRKQRVQYINLYKHFTQKKTEAESKSNKLDLAFTKDGVHINKDAYKIWASIIKRYIIN